MIKIAYILGTTRSGTSAIRNALAQTRYKGYGEGHLISILNGVVQTVRHEAAENRGVKVRGNGISVLRESVLIRHFFHAYERYLSEQIGSQYLLDKTPNILPIVHAQDLANFHQDARFIHCTRRHVDNLHSKRKKFADVPFANHCNEWAECNRAWKRTKQFLKEDRYTAFDYHDLVTEREATCRKIGELLDLHEVEIEKMVEYLLSERPQKTNLDAGLDDYLRLSEAPWSDQDKATFIRICGPVGDEMGYGLETYFI